MSHVLQSLDYQTKAACASASDTQHDAKVVTVLKSIQNFNSPLLTTFTVKLVFIKFSCLER